MRNIELALGWRPPIRKAHAIRLSSFEGEVIKVSHVLAQKERKGSRAHPAGMKMVYDVCATDGRGVVKQVEYRSKKSRHQFQSTRPRWVV